MSRPRPLATFLALAAVFSIGAGAALWPQVTPRSKVANFSIAARGATVMEGDRWIVSPPDAARLVAEGAIVLDARPSGLFVRREIANAVPFDWTEFARTDFPHQGQLLADDTLLAQKLQALGIDRGRPAIVVGDATAGWGQDGRAVWMLRTLGHEHAVMVDGGYDALVAAGVTAAAMPPAIGNFTVQRRSQWTIERDTLQARFDSADVVVLDARTSAEYSGATPHRERLGGHVPGARSLHYREFLTESGKLVPEAEIRERLEEVGIVPSTPIATYCTGGVRSAWLTVVLADLGYTVQNYAGSMWEWSAAPAAEYPLVRGKDE
ncbi:rhodanese-related sulfurtransferase [Rubidibacter lacunae KORDI 51-2]|uniref:thiosulfate sulfurtransferase n=1 Tax=Rubidibacter lacunae KORDI 51-2 TaxID=582515 RepID=U5DMB6_9CHRO|nr:rhodanese-like domain-containing protein [Rubidibacter lacunae]ERN40855.1 rhodanese-related sulfurtransferase [Rubidibacter lacunae KORDI 51-2]